MGKTSIGNGPKATSADFAKDVEAGIAYLNTRKEVDKNKIGLIGHSEGGLIASIVGSRSKDIDFIVMIAGPGLKGSKLLASQNEAILLSTGVSKEAAVAYEELYENIMRNAMEKDTGSAIAASTKAYGEWKQKTDSNLRRSVGIKDDIAAQQAIRAITFELSRPWFIYFFQTDPADYITRLNCKVLALNGSKDVQVVSRQNLEAIRIALKKSKSPGFETIELPGLNHLFQHCKACTVAEYGQLEETFSPEALDIIVKWLNKNVGN